MSAARRPSGSASRLRLLGAFLLVLVLTVSAASAGGLNRRPGYTNGPQVCGQCHPAEFNDWLAHGHSRKITQGPDLGNWPGGFGFTVNAQGAGIPLPDHDKDVYTWDNILFVIGGSKHWKTRFVGKDGFIITKGGKNQYNWETGEWVDYHPDEVRPFDCGPCHTTGYRDPAELPGAGFVGIPGIVGDFAHANITCEACHGPGAGHAKSADAADITVDTSAAACGACHTRGSDDNVALASGDFIRHHEQYPELLNSPHFFLPCVVCHDAHVGRAEGVKVWEGDTEICNVCHFYETDEYAGSSMQLADVKCQDCHMGKATKSAQAAGPYEGDVWTHLFRIDSSAEYDMFNRDDDGNAISAKNALSLEYACFRCHADADKATYAAYGSSAADYHKIGKK